jgi:hypothetical protein
MNSRTDLPVATPGAGQEPVRVRSHHGAVKLLGAWTTTSRFDVRASKSLVVLDLLVPHLESDTIEIALDVDHTTVKLLVPDGANIDHDDLRRIGRGRVKDWTGTAAPGGVRVRLIGEMRHSEVRVQRGGIAIVSLVLAGQGRAVRQAHREGRLDATGAVSR